MAKQDDVTITAGHVVTFFFVGLGAYAMYAMDWSFSKGQITDYTLMCASNDYVNNRCNGSFVQGPVVVYNVHPDQQFVISQVDGGTPIRLSKCALVDRKNWKCSISDSNELMGIVIYTDGEYQGILMPPFYKHVQRYEWLWADKGPGK